MAGEDPLIDAAVAAAVADAFEGSRSVAVCLGGGADSAVLAWAAASNPQTVRAVFVDHALPTSGMLRDAAVALSDRVGLDLRVVAAPIVDGPSLEGRARAARVEALERFRRDGEWLATGHSLDDQAETVLTRLLRGAGGTGLAAMAQRRCPWMRPLLGFPRAALREVAEHRGLPFADDPANADLRHLRNRLRHRLIPELEADYNPALRTVLARTAQILAADDAELTRMADDVAIGERLGAVLLPAPVLTTLPVPVASRVVRRALGRFLDPYAGSHADVLEILAMATAGSGRTTLSRGVIAEVEGPYVALHTGPGAVPSPARLAVPGAVPWAGWRLEARMVGSEIRSLRNQLLDADVAADAVAVRPAAAGDRIAMTTGTKLVRDALAEAGIPPRLRSVWPVIEVDAKIAAVPAVRVAPWARPAGPRAVAVKMIERDPT